MIREQIEKIYGGAVCVDTNFYWGWVGIIIPNASPKDYKDAPQKIVDLLNSRDSNYTWSFKDLSETATNKKNSVVEHRYGNNRKIGYGGPVLGAYKL